MQSGASAQQEPPIIFAQINDGYAVRNAISVIRQMCMQANLTFTPKGITLARSNAGNEILTIMEIYTSELNHYEMNTFDDEGKPIETLNVGINTIEMLKVTKLVGKKDGICMYMKPEDNNLYIQIISTSTKSGNRSSVNVVPTYFVEHEDYNPLKYLRGDDDPNAKPAAADFSKMCTAMATIKCTHVTATGYPKGVMFKGMLPGKACGRIDRFGNCTTADPTAPTFDLNAMLASLNTSDRVGEILPTAQDPGAPGGIPCVPGPKLVLVKSEDLNTVNIKIAVIKALSKLNNLSTNGVIKIYMEEKKPLKIVCNIGTYGRLTVIIRNVEC